MVQSGSDGQQRPIDDDVVDSTAVVTAELLAEIKDMVREAIVSAVREVDARRAGEREDPLITTSCWTLFPGVG